MLEEHANFGILKTHEKTKYVTKLLDNTDNDETGLFLRLENSANQGNIQISSKYGR